MTEFVTPHLRTVLKTYQDSATKSLQGPGLSLHHKLEINTSSNSINNSINNNIISNPSNNTSIIITNGNSASNATTISSINNNSTIDDDDHLYTNSDDKILQKIHLSPPIIPPQPPPLPQPILSTSDSGRGILQETVLEGKRIGCFLLGGELRLCIPQIFNILKDFSVDQINRIIDDLRIFCSQCTQEQLNEFKSAKILPEVVKTSGLMTRTNAERLCSALLHRSERNIRIINTGKNSAPPLSFKVYHRCFGKCEGILTPDLYSFKEPSCIECLECRGTFSPQRFVCHAHRQQENRVCHWGFDSNMWRSYLHVSPDEDNVVKYTKILDELRERELFDSYSLIHQQHQRDRELMHLKRKVSGESSFIYISISFFYIMIARVKWFEENFEMSFKDTATYYTENYLGDLDRQSQLF